MWAAVLVPAVLDLDHQLGRRPLGDPLATVDLPVDVAVPVRLGVPTQAHPDLPAVRALQADGALHGPTVPV